MNNSQKQQLPREPWAEIADELAALRRKLLEIHNNAQFVAKHADMATPTAFVRSLTSRKQADAAGTIGTELSRWELLCRNESARLELRR